MRLYNPFKLVQTLLGIGGDAAPRTVTVDPGASADAESAASKEAARKVRQAALLRGGRRSTLLTAPGTSTAGLTSPRTLTSA